MHEKTLTTQNFLVFIPFIYKLELKHIYLKKYLHISIKKKMIMRKLLIILILMPFASISQTATQSVPFNGVIIDIHNTPIKRARVYTTNANYYALTDKQGKFGLTNVAADDTIHVKYKGKMYIIPVDGMKGMRIRLADQTVASVEYDEQLVSVGYGFVKKREHTNSSSIITGEELVRTGYYDVLEALQGLVPGLRIEKGKFGSEATANIRASGSIIGPTEPLYIVDGMIVDSFSGVSVYAVDRVEVLKDANIYGVRGSNGAILVYTKKGSMTR